jgi:hypothetical protein
MKTRKRPKRAAKSGKKKQSNLGQRQRRKKEGRRAETGGGVSKCPTPTDFPSEITEAEKQRLEREDAERNKESPNAGFYFGANAKLRELFRRAKTGDADAARMLLGCLTYNVDEFQKLCSSTIKIAKKIVVVGDSWPLLHTDLKANKDGAPTIPPGHFLRKLGLVRGKRRYNTASKGTGIAFVLYNQMEHYRHTPRQTLRDKREMNLDAAIDRVRQLKPLSPSNYSDWWKAATPLFIWQWGEEFQDHPDFENWNAGAYSKRNLERLAEKSGRKQSARSAKRRDVKRAVEQGFMSLANSLRERVLD